MRERKFRAWQIDHMVYFTLQDLYWRGEATGEYDFPKGPPVMQYAGLKDKNSKEIYEGDIVGNENILTPGAPIMCDCYSWSVGDGWPMYEYFSQYGNNLRIIGNIHENPELLEEK